MCVPGCLHVSFVIRHQCLPELSKRLVVVCRVAVQLYERLGLWLVLTLSSRREPCVELMVARACLHDGRCSAQQQMTYRVVLAESMLPHGER